MLVCYLDDSGTDSHNPLVTMAGYIGTVDAWEAFELQAAEFFTSWSISLLHGREFYNNDGEFKGWKIDDRLEFVRQFNRILAPRVGLAVSFSTLKSTFESHRGSKHKVQSPYGCCFQGIIDQLLKDDGFAAVVKRPDVTISFMIEEGNNNNAEIFQRYQRLKHNHGKELSFLRDMVFVEKNSSIAIQAADLFAFLSRRQAVTMERNNREPIKHHQYLAALRKDIRDIGFAATDFGYRD